MDGTQAEDGCAIAAPRRANSHKRTELHLVKTEAAASIYRS